MEYGNVSKEEYHSGVDALKWTLLEKRSDVKRIKEQLVYAEQEVVELETTLKGILNVRPD